MMAASDFDSEVKQWARTVAASANEGQATKRFKISTRGLSETVHMLEQIGEARSYVVKVVCKPTKGAWRIKGKPWGNRYGRGPGGRSTVTEYRDAGKNITIYRTQAKKGRAAALNWPREFAEIRAAWKDGCALALKDARSLLEAAHEVGRLAVQYIRDHIKQGMAVGGMRENKPETDRRKLYETGSTRPLHNTGQLMESLDYEVKELTPGSAR